ncbi:MAG: right-handed parallel beta-helix repeat-containing protein, partial [Planctomycetia bacterium]
MRIDGGWRERIFGGLMMAAGVLASAWGCGGEIQAAPAEFYVAPAGDDAADGRLGRPVATLRRALDLVRDLRKRRANPAPITIEVADGRYELADTLLITAEDSAGEKSPTIIHAAEDAHPTFSGGRRITGWTVTEVDGRPRWSAVLPELKGGKWRFTQLFVDGQRRFRPTLPAEGWFTIGTALPPSPAAEGRGHDRFAAAAGEILREWSQRDAIEVVAVHQWSMSRMRIAAIEAGEESATANVQLVGTTSSLDPWGALAAGSRYRLENVREALGSPGSWYFDVSSGTLTYCPLDGEDPETTEVVAPRVDTLLSVRGEPVPGGTVDHIRFVGLSFTHGNWAMPPRGQSAAQGDLNVGAAVSLTGARDVQFIRCGIRHVGRYGLALGVGCGRCLVDRCELLDLGAGGVMVGATAAGGRPIARVTENTIRDCTIAHGG